MACTDPRVSDAAKEHAQEMLDRLQHGTIDLVDDTGDEHLHRQLGGYKATLKSKSTVHS